MYRLVWVLIFTLSVHATAFPQIKGKRLSFETGYREVNISMPDGVNLSTDVFIPKTRTPCAVILVRTPYNKVAEKWMGKTFGLFNIAVVIQDVRGKFKSEGVYYPFRNERSDGLATLKWIRSQPWSNGIVSGWGASYLGFTQWAISDSLDFMVPLLTGANLYDFVYPDGVYSLQSAFNWGFQNASKNQNSLPADKIKKAMSILPVSAADDSTICEIPFLTDWMTHDTDDWYWQQMSFRGKTKAPILCVAGWYDIFLKAQLNDFLALEKNGNQKNRMVIGPWCHGSMGYPSDYGGPKKTSDPKKLLFYTLKMLKGKSAKLSSPLRNAKYNLFIMERNEYVGSESWPPRETTVVPYYLGSGNHLTKEANPENGVLSYRYDPADPFPSYGGTALGDSVGPAVQNANLSRRDQLTFDTEILEKPLILLGDISATLWLSSDAACTDFVVGLQDVFPDGKIINIQEGIAKAKFNGNDPQRTEISVWSTGYQLNPGHRLHVVVTSSWFPRFNRSLNGCESFMDATVFKGANQKVFYGTQTPSCINLPVYKN